MRYLANALIILVVMITAFFVFLYYNPDLGEKILTGLFEAAGCTSRTCEQMKNTLLF